MAEDTKSPDNEKKQPRKVPIIDANEPSETSDKETGKVKSDAALTGDTPPLDATEKKELREAEKTASAETVKKDDSGVPKDLTIEEAMAVAAVKNETETETPPEEPVAPKDVDVATDDSTDAQPAEPVEKASETVETDQQTPTDSQKTGDEQVAGQPETPVDFSDSATDKAIDAIVAAEGDELLEKQDQQAGRSAIIAPKKRSFKQVIKDWWNTPAIRWGILTGLFLLVILIILLPVTRYAILNALGVRASSSVTVMSAETQQPLKNASVSLAGQTVQTDDQGLASFSELQLGKTTLIVQKRGYTKVEQTKTLGWGSNPLGQVALSPTGVQYVFITQDFLSGKPVTSAEATSGEYNGQADQDGKIILPIDAEEAQAELEVTIRAEGYREEKIKLAQNDTGEKTVKMVAARKHVFVSKRSGKYDIYKIDADGTNEAVLMAATGSERDDLTVLQHPIKDYAAIVSTREGKRNSGGYLLSGLYVVNVISGEQVKIIQSENIRLVDWSGDRIVFTAVTEGLSAANPARSKLYSFEIGQPGPKEIASANYINDVVVFFGSIYYAPSSSGVQVSEAKLYRANADGSNKTVMLNSEVWNINRSSYDTLQFMSQDEWYEIKTGTDPKKLTEAPVNPRNFVYRDSPDKKRSLWVDNRDGKGVLLAYNTETKQDDTLQTQAGLGLPTSWLNNTTYVYRINDGREIADYVKSTEGGEAKKLRDVTNTDFTRYYYYYQ